MELLCSTCIGKKIELLSVGSYFAGFIYYNYDFYFFFLFFCSFRLLMTWLLVFRFWGWVWVWCEKYFYTQSIFIMVISCLRSDLKTMLCVNGWYYSYFWSWFHIFFSAREIIDLPYKKNHLARYSKRWSLQGSFFTIPSEGRKEGEKRKLLGDNYLDAGISSNFVGLRRRCFELLVRSRI